MSVRTPLAFAALFAAAGLALAACQEPDTPAERLEESLEDTGDAIEDMADDVADEAEEAADDVERAAPQ